jgi:hypothetical protein
MMRTPWNSPLINTLTTDDAGRLQQIFMSLSFELSEMRKEVEDLKRLVASMDRRGYGVRP